MLCPVHNVIPTHPPTNTSNYLFIKLEVLHSYLSEMDMAWQGLLNVSLAGKELSRNRICSVIYLFLSLNKHEHFCSLALIFLNFVSIKLRGAH